MKRPYRLVVFDWEGTLGDTLGQILNAIATEARRLNFGELDEDLARQYVSLGLEIAIKKNFPLLSLHQQEQLLQAVQQALLVRSTDTYLIPGAKNLIQKMSLAGLDLAIATNKGQQSLSRVLHACGLDEFIKVTRSAGQAPAKPCPQMLEEIMEVFDVKAVDTLMIGDSVTDVEMAKSLGIDVIGFDFYRQHEEALRAEGALEVFDNYEQLANYLQLPKY